MKNSTEIERKYIILKPAPSCMRALDGYTESHITQTYLYSAENETRRVRKRVWGDRVEYTETVKRRLSRMSASEKERELSESEYSILLSEICQGTAPLEKIRYTFTYLGKVFEVDFYPQWYKTAILETELQSEDEHITFPDFIKILREVSGIREYTNAHMSMKFPDEII